MKSKIPVLALALAASLHLRADAAPEPLDVYFIGNSLTMSTTLDRVHALFEQRGTDLQFGSSVSAGKSLIRHWNYRTPKEQRHKWQSWETNVPEGDTFAPSENHWTDDPKKYRFGLWDEALAGHQWDKVVLQLYGSNLHDDLIAIPALIRYALEHDASQHFYIYSTWPRRERARDEDNRRTGPILNIDYGGEWTTDYTATAEQTGWKAGWHYNSRDYVDTLFAHLADELSELPESLRLIPTGEVLFRIDQMIKQDQLPGLRALAERSPEHLPGLDEDTSFADGVNILYADGVHLNPQPHKGSTLGIFISGTTLYTVLSGQSPVGLSGAPYDLDDTQDAALIEAVQKTIWEVVTSDPRTGVSRK